jgi:hypothetical protein
MHIQTRKPPRRVWHGVPTDGEWAEAGDPASRVAAEVIARRTSALVPTVVRSYFTTCALHCCRRVPTSQLAALSGISLSTLRYRLSTVGLTPSAIAVWHLALHATWLLDVAALPPAAVVTCMHLGRSSALGAVLGARGVRFSGGEVPPGAFSSTLERYSCVLRAAFSA